MMKAPYVRVLPLTESRFKARLDKAAIAKNHDQNGISQPRLPIPARKLLNASQKRGPSENETEDSLSARPGNPPWSRRSAWLPVESTGLLCLQLEHTVEFISMLIML